MEAEGSSDIDMTSETEQHVPATSRSRVTNRAQRHSGRYGPRLVPNNILQFVQLGELYDLLLAEELEHGLRYSHVVRMRSDHIWVHVWPPARILNARVPAGTLAGPNLASLQGCDKFWIASRHVARATIKDLASMVLRPHEGSALSRVLDCAGQADEVEKNICELACASMWAEAIVLAYLYVTVGRGRLVGSCEVTGEFLENASQNAGNRLCRSRKGWQGVYNAREIDHLRWQLEEYHSAK